MKRQTDRQRQRETEIERQTDRDRERQTDRQRARARESERKIGDGGGVGRVGEGAPRRPHTKPSQQQQRLSVCRGMFATAAAVTTVLCAVPAAALQHRTRPDPAASKQVSSVRAPRAVLCNPCALSGWEQGSTLSDHT